MFVLMDSGSSVLMHLSLINLLVRKSSILPLGVFVLFIYYIQTLVRRLKNHRRRLVPKCDICVDAHFQTREKHRLCSPASPRGKPVSAISASDWHVSTNSAPVKDVATQPRAPSRQAAVAVAAAKNRIMMKGLFSTVTVAAECFE